MNPLIFYLTIVLSMYSTVVVSEETNDESSWTAINCNKFEVVLEDPSHANQSEQILLDNMHEGGADLPCPCIGIKKQSIYDLTFDNYDISASMLYVDSDAPEEFGYFGLIFNYQDDKNFEYIYLG